MGNEEALVDASAPVFACVQQTCSRVRPSKSRHGHQIRYLHAEALHYSSRQSTLVPCPTQSAAPQGGQGRCGSMVALMEAVNPQEGGGGVSLPLAAAGRSATPILASFRLQRENTICSTVRGLERQCTVTLPFHTRELSSRNSASAARPQRHGRQGQRQAQARPRRPARQGHVPDIPQHPRLRGRLDALRHPIQRQSRGTHLPKLLPSPGPSLADVSVSCRKSSPRPTWKPSGAAWANFWLCSGGRTWMRRSAPQGPRRSGRRYKRGSSMHLSW